MTIDELKRLAERLAATADTISARFASELGDVLRRTERRLAPLLRDVTAGNRTAIVKAAQANRVRKDLRDVLEAAGYDDLAHAATAQPLDWLADQVLGRRRLASASADLATGTVLRLKALQLVDLLDEGDELARLLWKATVRGVFNAQDVDTILADLALVMDRTEPQIRTLYDTSVSIYGRQVEALQAGDDPETTFLYAGPEDEKNRPFCQAHVNKVFTRAEIDRLSNGQLDNVFLTGGGYNCRHVWMEVAASSALRPAA